jgi:hypothetical protein
MVSVPPRAGGPSRCARSLLLGVVLAALLAVAPAVAGAATPLITVGFDAGAAPQVSIFDGKGAVQGNFLAEDQAFAGGVRVAKGDVNGDGTADIITGAGAGGGPHVKVFDGITGNLLSSFFAFAQTFTGGVFVAAGDVNGDGFADIVVGAGPGGGPQVKVFDGKTGQTTQSFDAFDAAFTGGVRVATGDVNGDGTADIITGAGAGGGPHVKVFDGRTSKPIDSFDAFDPAFSGGVYVAAGDVNGDGRADIITGAGAGGGPHVQVFDGRSQQPFWAFDAFAPDFAGGVRVAVGDVNGDGVPDVIAGAGPGGGPQVSVFDGARRGPLLSFFAGPAAFVGGIFVAGSPKGATDQVPDLHGLLASFALAPGLGTYFQNKVSSVQKTFATGQSACPSMLIGLLLPAVQKAGKARGMLGYAAAQRLVTASYSILIGLGCTPSTSPQPVAVNELIGLLDVVDSAKPASGETRVLIGLLRRAGASAVLGDGSVCPALGAVVARIGVDSGRKAFPQGLIGLLLPAVQKLQREEGCVAGS